MSGSDGSDGNDGNLGKDGTVTWIVNDVNGNVIEQSNKLYDLELSNPTFIDQNGDGIFEPGDEFQVGSIEICNIGGITLPATTYLKLVNYADLNVKYATFIDILIFI
jgi:hypothetical protein